MKSALEREKALEKRNKAIIEQLKLGLTPSQITKLKDSKGNPVFTNLRKGNSKPLTTNSIRNIQKRFNISVNEENLIHLYIENPIKTNHNNVEDAFAAALSNPNFDDFMTASGYKSDGVANRGARSRKDYKDGVFYIMRYKEKGLDVIKYGISTSHYQKKRWQMYRLTNIRKGLFSSEIEHELLFSKDFNSYPEAQALESIVKKSFGSDFLKEQFPDGFSETIMYSDAKLQSMLSLIKNSLK